jgi:hypothetical protein
MKRAIAFAKLDYPVLTDESGKQIVGSDGSVIHTKVSNVQDDTSGWTLMQNFYAAGSGTSAALYDSDGKAIVDLNNRQIRLTTPAWLESDIAFEVLTDSIGEIITDINNENIYVL